MVSPSDSTPLALQAVGGLPPRGTSGTKWQFKSRQNGVRKVLLKASSGQYKLAIKTKRWFPTAAAQDSAANTRLTVSIGNQCFTHAATKKVD